MNQDQAGKTKQQSWRVGTVDELPATTPDERDFRPVYSRLRRQAIAVAASYVGRDAAKDVYQDVAVRMFEEWSTLPLNQRTEAYLMQTVINAAKDRHRRDKRLLPLSADMEELPQFQLQPVDSETSEIQGHEILDPIVDRLPPQQRAVWLLRRQGLSYKQVADELGIKERTVARHIQEATEFVRAGIERAGIRITRERALEMARDAQLKIARGSAPRSLAPRTGEVTDV